MIYFNKAESQQKHVKVVYLLKLMEKYVKCSELKSGFKKCSETKQQVIKINIRYLNHTLYTLLFNPCNIPIGKAPALFNYANKKTKTQKN